MILLFKFIKSPAPCITWKVKIIYLGGVCHLCAGNRKEQRTPSRLRVCWGLPTIQRHCSLSLGLPQLSLARPCSWAGYSLLLE